MEIDEDKDEEKGVKVFEENGKGVTGDEKAVDVQVHQTGIEDNKGIEDNMYENQTAGVTSDIHEDDEEVHQTEDIEV